MAWVVNEYCYQNEADAIAAFNSTPLRFYGFNSGWAETHVHPAVNGEIPIYLHYYPLNGGQRVDTNSGHNLPLCSKPGNLRSLIFDPTTMDPVSIADAVGHGFMFVAVPLLVVWGGRLILKQLFP